MKALSFEQGPIRPPSEARSLLIRLTRNCSWNNCLFCPVFADKKFSRRSAKEVKADIDTIVQMIDAAKETSFRLGLGGQVTAEVVNQTTGKQTLSTSFQSVIGWMYYDTRAVFLQDANNLILKTDDLVGMLTYLNEKIADISRITTYSRSKTASRKSLDELRRIRDAGLDRVHLGLESGYDPLLKLMKKGVTAKAHIEAGQKIIAAGMELSEYYMPGLGGEEMWQAHAFESAKVINQINPHFIRLRTMHIHPILPLYAHVESGAYQPRTEDAIVEEIRFFIEHLDGITSFLASDHIGNLLQDVEGHLPEDKPRMLRAIDRYLDLDPDERIHYRLGRLMGLYASVLDMDRPGLTSRVDKALDEVNRQFPGNIEEAFVQIKYQTVR